MSDPQLAHLLHVLEARGIGLGRDDVAWAFQSPDTSEQLSAWIDEHLSPETLLTREELTFHEKHNTSSASDIATGPLLSDEDFESAISSLEASTASIEKQCKLLEAQKQALRKIQSRNASDRTHDSSSNGKSNRHAREKAQSEFEASELADSLQARLERASKQAEHSSTGILPMVERLLEKDNRLLDGLEKVLPKLTANATDAAELDEVERLCQALTVLSTQEIHARIDATYNAAIRDYSSQTNGSRKRQSSQSLESQRDSLRAELEELCREIDGLSTMAVEAQYRTAISRALQSAMSDNETEQAAWAEYMSSALQYLTVRLEATDETSRDIRAQRSALKTINAAFQAIQASSSDSKAAQNRAQSPVKQSQKGLKPLRLVQANLSESHDPVTQLLRQLDVKVTDSGDGSQFTGSLAASTKDKLEKLSSLATISERGIADQLAQSLAEADADMQTLLAAVFEHSPYGTVRLADQGATDGIEDLEQKTQILGEKMRGLNVEQIAKEVKKRQQVLLQG
ncbi:uncharacterized protein LTR77_010814 [Saxophila tyrrhenica]|uniref:HAUS augmin-like complex subunit 3 N-terminal domain-containing protein n=1 Tax=Saxophila tyrrhenica TaxID=1690608 RepID=A0AAV9NWT6_9PEZI|nr:hypothetical protein LTR77_010814 [Saxophila tyrrhenica]